MSEEEIFFKNLEQVFTGFTDLEENFSFFNRTRNKSQIFNNYKQELKEEIEDEILEELVDDDFIEKAYKIFNQFFKTFISSSNPVFFGNLVFQNKLFDQIYSDSIDTMLFWKESILYNIENKENTNIFIHKNIKENLQEELYLWLYENVYKDIKVMDEENFQFLRILKKIGRKIIALIAQFENELLKIWQKPRFVLDSNYVISLNKVLEYNAGKEFIEEFIDSDYFSMQLNEWNSEPFNFIPTSINKDDIKDIIQEREGYEEYLLKLPLDTKHLSSELKKKFLSIVTNIDGELDGWLIESELLQALNNIEQKFENKIKTIFVNPPLINISSNFEDMAIWNTFLENRLLILRNLLNEKGAIFSLSNDDGKAIMKLLLDDIFDKNNFRNELVISKPEFSPYNSKKFIEQKYSLFLFSKSDALELKEYNVYTQEYYAAEELVEFFSDYVENEEEREEICNAVRDTLWKPLDHRYESRNNPDRILFGRPFTPPRGRHWGSSQANLDIEQENGKLRLVCKNCSYIHSKGDWSECPECGGNDPAPEKLVDSEIISELWLNIDSFMDYDGEVDISETLMDRVILTTSRPRDIVLEPFCITGTMLVKAQKLNRRWIGISKNIQELILPRMKSLLPESVEQDDIGAIYNGGVFFKYYALEQFQDIILKLKYEDLGTIQLLGDDKEFFQRDSKLLDIIEIERDTDSILFKPSNLYSNIDIPESLSNFTGKFISDIGENGFTLEDEVIMLEDSILIQKFKKFYWW